MFEHHTHCTVLLLLPSVSHTWRHVSSRWTQCTTCMRCTDSLPVSRGSLFVNRFCIRFIVHSLLNEQRLRALKKIRKTWVFTFYQACPILVGIFSCLRSAEPTMECEPLLSISIYHIYLYSSNNEQFAMYLNMQ